MSLWGFEQRSNKAILSFNRIPQAADLKIDCRWTKEEARTPVRRLFSSLGKT